jgi:glycosyltransferase involved in cell wall biosynthesis
MQTSVSKPWIVCQLGAREHYSIPRALNSAGVLERLITDVWVPKSHLIGFGPWPRLRQRFHSALPPSKVRAWTWEAALRSTLLWHRLNGWNRFIAQNNWFGKKAATELSGLDEKKLNGRVVFSYSYTARPVFELAKARGWTTVLGQIDAGPMMVRVMGKLEDCYGGAQLRADPPAKYWADWREECAMADRIVVNSAWSRECLAQEGIPTEKVAIIPLAYEAPAGMRDFHREAPEHFTHERPLRLLFLGQVTFLKGIVPLLEAVAQLHDEPVELTVVGPELCQLRATLRSQSRVRWVGPVPRGATAEFYQQADVFVFPSFCDGFGLTQLEAQAWGLPIIASKFCGDVVKEGFNGFLLPEVTPAAIVTALRRCIAERNLLARLARNSFVAPEFRLNSVTHQLLEAAQN